MAIAPRMATVFGTLTDYLGNSVQTGTMGDPIFDSYYASTVQFPKDSPEQERTMLAAGTALLDRIGPVVLIAHSQGGLFGWSWADARPELVKALIQVEPKGPPFREAIFSDVMTRKWGLTSIPLTYSPSPTPLDPTLSWKGMPAACPNEVPYSLQEEPARELTNLKSVPTLIVTGEASYHAMYDHHTVAFLQQAGCDKLEHMKLASRGIHGNGHLMFLEKNSDGIAREIENWIRSTVEQRV